MLIIATIATFLVVMLLFFALQGPPFVPSRDDDVEAMLRACKLKKHQRILDLGSGDGKLVIAFADAGYRVDGVEVNPRLVRRSRKEIARRRLTDQASIIQGSMWKFDTAEYDVVLLYSIHHVMGRLEKKLLTELQPGSVVLSNYFSFPHLRPERTVGRINVYVIPPRSPKP